MHRTILFSLGLGLALIAPALAAPVTLQQATASFHQSSFGNKDQTINTVIAGGDGMGFFQGLGAPASGTNITWETATTQSGNGLLTFNIHSLLGSGHTLQSFRLSVTDANRSFFSNNLPPNGAEAPAGDVLAAPGRWTLLQPVSATSSGGATMGFGANHEINVSGTNPSTDVYTITARSPLANITGVRLEVLPGINGFIGRSAGAPHGSNGNATISEFQADFAPGGAGVFLPTYQVNLQNPTATFEQPGFLVSATLDGVNNGNGNGWAVGGGHTSAQTAVFQTTSPIDTGHLVFEIDQTSHHVAHKMQDFRLSYTTDPNPTTLTANWTQIKPTAVNTSLAGSIGTVDLSDNSIVISGDPAVPDIYQVIADGNFKGITGFRLESFTVGGVVGFGGNFVITEFNVFAQETPEPGSLAVWSLLGLGALGLAARRRLRHGK